MLVSKYASTTSVRYVVLLQGLHDHFEFEFTAETATGLFWDRSFFWGADYSGKNFLESVEEDFRIVDDPEVSSKELNLGVK
jgi:hypothetical protein